MQLPIALPSSGLPKGWYAFKYLGSPKPAIEVFSEVLDKLEVVYTLEADQWVQVTEQQLLVPYCTYYIKGHLPAPIPFSLRWFYPHF